MPDTHDATSESAGSPGLGRKLSLRVVEAQRLLKRQDTMEKLCSQTLHITVSPAAAARTPRTLGRFLADRVADLGIKHWFGVPGDFNLGLLDLLLEEKRMKMISCCNELNAGYAADGYARANGISCLVTTFGVGALSAINAIAGAYSEDHPVIVIVGAPHSAYWGRSEVLHHSLGKGRDLDFELHAFAQVTCYQVQARHLDSALYFEIDKALAAAVMQRKPVYISVPLDVAPATDPAFAREGHLFSVPLPASNTENLDAAVASAAAFLSRAVKPVLLAGAHLRSERARSAMIALAEASGMPVAVMPNARGCFPEDHPSFIGVFWATISWPCTGEVVVSADAYLFAGPVWNDMSTQAFTQLIQLNSAVVAEREAVKVGGDAFFGGVLLPDFLERLALKVKPNGASLDRYLQLYCPPGVLPPQQPGSPLMVKSLYRHIQALLAPEHALLVDAGDSWFHANRLRLPGGAAHEIQMQYASIGWSVGATLGYALARPDRRVVTIVGDGAFQMTAQELSTIFRYKLNPVIIIVNNGAYTIEVELHDGPYNEIDTWDYASLARSLDNGRGRVHAVQVRTEEECIAAMEDATRLRDKAVVIEAIVSKQDCSLELLQLGKALQFAAAGLMA